jgi:hypothetical protein
MKTCGCMSPAIVNERLCANATPEDLERLGFVRQEDDTGSPWGVSWERTWQHFRVWIDCTFVVHLSRTDSDPIKVIVEDLHDLEMLCLFAAD